MTLKLMLITNDSKVAIAAQDSGVDWIFVDLELKGKSERQKGRNTVISAHNFNDISNIRAVLTNSKLLVRINPMGEWSKSEIDEVIRRGADLVMLPFFERREEVDAFVSYVGGRAKTIILLETLEGINNLDEILQVEGINYLHIGLNDIHIAQESSFMFEPLSNGLVESILQAVGRTDISFGFGGVANLEADLRPSAKSLLAEHYRLGSSMVILSRSFLASSDNIEHSVKASLRKDVEALRQWEAELTGWSRELFEDNKRFVASEIAAVVAEISQ
jgi:2-keto-3-deoxy-L-rhamnonate aldolase RhmA